MVAEVKNMDKYEVKATPTERGIAELGKFQRTELDGEPVLFMPLESDDPEPGELGELMTFHIPGSDLIHYGRIRDVITSNSRLRGDYRVAVIAPIGVRVRGDDDRG